MDLTESSQVISLYVGPGADLVGHGSIMLVPNNPSVEFFTLSGAEAAEELPLRNGQSCERNAMNGAQWLVQDTATMLPSVSWWKLPELNADDDVRCLFCCCRRLVVVVGVVVVVVVVDIIVMPLLLVPTNILSSSL